MNFTQAEQDIKEVSRIDLWNGGYVSKYDFSKANSSEAHRVYAVTTIANVCRGDKGIKDREALYQQLLTEHDGRPGSVFEFVPYQIGEMLQGNSIGRHRTFDINTGYYMTNLRAVLVDGSDYHLNTGLTDFKVFKVKVPQMIVKHILRHRMLSFQEMSERTNKLREYYYCDELEPIIAKEFNWFNTINPDGIVYTKDDYAKHWDQLCYKLSQRDFDILQKQYKIRQELLNKGSHGLAYTTLWIAGWKQDHLGWDNFFAVRTKKPAQREIIELANVIKEMMEG